jgi:mannose/fructose/N-acetylgalactosamine-specific phosphotransferase system component IIB
MPVRPLESSVISLVRVDNRLIHGQVVEAWLPALKAERIVVADDESARSPLVRSAMALAVQSDVEVKIQSIHEVDFKNAAQDTTRTLMLFRDVAGVRSALALGLSTQVVNLGNVHFGMGRKAVSSSVFLAPDEVESLEQMASTGITVEARALPSDKPMGLLEIAQKVRG